MRYISLRLLKVALFAVLCLGLFSCRSYKNTGYFTDVSDAADTIVNTSVKAQISKIKQGDALIFNITTLDQATNPSISSSSTPPSLTLPQTGSYQVDRDGMIELPVIGKLKVDGLTIDEAKEAARKRFSVDYKVFSLNLAYASHKVTILGEVARPGSYPTQTDKVTIFEALALAGDITVYGKKENVLLMREEPEKKHIVRLNLLSKDIITSPYYYLRSDDVLYVEATRAKIASTDAYQQRMLRLFTVGLSALLIIVNFIKK